MKAQGKEKEKRKEGERRAEVATPELFPTVAVQTVTADGRTEA